MIISYSCFFSSLCSCLILSCRNNNSAAVAELAYDQQPSALTAEWFLDCDA